MSKKSPFRHLNLSWQRMKLGMFVYKGTYTGAKANVCRANRAYAPKKWRTWSDAEHTYVERVA